MELRVLGSVEVANAALGPKERALLCRLVVGLGRPVSAGELIAALWEVSPPRTAVKTLQGNVLRLRKALTADNPRSERSIGIASSPGGYRLTASDPDSVDLLAFETLVDVANAAAARRDHDAVAASLRSALLLWRGAPFGEFADREWAIPEGRRLEELHAAAWDDLFEAELARGRHHVVVAELEPRVAAEPLRERSWEQLALALYRCGRQADALRTIQRARATLVREVGVEPGPALKELEQAILGQDTALDLAGNRGALDVVGARQTATFLFTDVVGSTQRWERDALDMRVALDRQDGLLRAAIAGSGGEVFKSVGDALHAAFSTASAAIEAAIGGARALVTEEWQGDPLEVRFAVYTGEAEVVDGDWLGRPLNRCARLLASASGGQILVSHTTARLAESDLPADVHLVGLGAHRFRGLDRAEDVFQVVAPGLASEFGPLAEAELEDMGARRDSANVAPFPSSLAGRVTPAWVGRDHELDVLRSAWREAAAGTFRTVLVAGEPGAGKTALAAQFASEVAQDGGWVLHGHSDEDAVVPYRAFAETLEQLVGAAGGSLLAEHTTDHGGDLCAIVPLLARRVPGLRPTPSTTPEADRVRIAAAVSGLLEAGARQRPILLIFDDLHWADAATVGLVRDLVQRSAAARLLLLATYRSTHVERQQPSAQLFADLRREPGVTRVALAGLKNIEVGELVRSTTGLPLDDHDSPFVESLRQDTDGNPFFIIEVLRHLIEVGGLSMNAGRWSVDTAVTSLPEGIREVIGRRLDRVGADASDALRTASVIGPSFDLRILAEVLDLGQDRVVDLLELAGTSHLVTEVPGAVDRWQFTHELVRRTLADELSLSRRARVHRRVGEVLERRRPLELGALALHFAAAAGLGDIEPAIRYATAAADQAAADAAHGDAARFLKRGMDAAEAASGLGDVERVELLTRIGSETAKAGDAEAAIQFLDRAAVLARTMGSAELLGLAVLARTTYAVSLDPNGEDQRLIADALDAGLLSPATRARLLAASARLGAYGIEPLEKKRAVVAAAVAAARALGDAQCLGDALVSSLYLGAGPADLTARGETLSELHVAATATGRPDWSAIAWAFQADQHLTLGQYEAAREAEAEVERVATISRDPFAALTLRELASRRACIDGDFREAERLAVDDAALGVQIGIRPGAMDATTASLHITVWNLEGRFEHVEEVLGVVPAAGEWAQMHQLWMAAQRARQGRLEEAAAALGKGVPIIDLGRNWGVGVAETAEAIVRLDDPVRAASLLAQLKPYAHLDCVFDWVQYRGAIVHHMGRLLDTARRFDDAITRLHEARTRYQQLRSPPWLVLVERDLARALRGRAGPGDETSASTFETHASEEARMLGMPDI